MRPRLGAAALTLALAISACSQPPAPQAYRAPRTPDGAPDINGIWQALNTANWDLEAHVARQGPVVALGAAFSVPPGLGVVEGGEIPYLPDALARKKANGENWMTLDPEVKCFMPGIPRATYMPYPFQIVQSADTILMTYEFASASRIVRMNSKETSPAPAWMGWSVGRWEGETLIIDVTDHMEETWFDRAGNYHSDALKVTERYTPIDANTLQYDATIEDPKVFSRAWTISMPLYRRREPDIQLMEYKCVEFAEELMYGHLRKQPAAR
ncbi:MAG: hypothetical protein ACT4QD_13690 [Acidobacteriota bacterium]